MNNIEGQPHYSQSSERRLINSPSNAWSGIRKETESGNGSFSAPGLVEAGVMSSAVVGHLEREEQDNIRNFTGNLDNTHTSTKENQTQDLKSLTRRKLLQIGAGAFLGATAGKLFDQEPQVASAQDGEVAYISGEAGFSTPVPDSERDVRVQNVSPTEVTREETLISNPPHLPIESVSLNPNFSETEAQNRLDVAMTNGLIRAHCVSQRYLAGQDFSGMLGYLSAGEYPEEPNWAEYIQRLQSDEQMMFSMMALSMDAPVDGANVTWKEADLRKGVRLHFVSEPGLITAFGQPNGIQEMGWSYRVDDEGQLQIDLHMNYSIMEQYFTDMQLSYNTGATMTAQLALQGLSTTLGIVDHSKKSNLYQSYIIGPQYEYVMNAGKENFTRSFFREQDELLMGDPYLNAQGFAEYFPNSVLHVNLANTK